MVSFGVNSQQVYGFVEKIQGPEQVAIPPTFCLYQYSLGGDLVEVFMLIVIENAAVIEEFGAY